MALPMDNFLLLSVVNTKLRDYYINLDALCDELDEDKSNIISRLASVGYGKSVCINERADGNSPSAQFLDIKIFRCFGIFDLFAVVFNNSFKEGQFVCSFFEIFFEFS